MSAARRAREPAAPYLRGAGVLVDSNVLIDILGGDPQWAEWSMQQMEPLMLAGRAVINPIIYAEVATPFLDIETLEGALQPYSLIREALPWEAAFLASRAFQLYRRQGGNKRSPLPDFYIAAHASIAGHALLTRDPKRYRGYFPRLDILAPG